MGKNNTRKKISEQAINPMGGATPPLSWSAADEALYGKVGDGEDLGIPVIERRVQNGIKLSKIRPDMKQPRRTIPAIFRKGWDGNPAKIPQMLGEWHVASEKQLGEVIDAVLLIDRLTLDGREIDKDLPPMVADYLALVALASSIKRDGLTNPISISGRRDPYTVETGERRYMAYHLLNKWFPDGGFDAIPAAVVENADVWKQASENGNRRELNAIGFARQLALLIMDMYLGDDGVSFNDITFFDHEQDFYKQVANGNIWRIKKGMGERVLQVTGLKSLAQVNQYRSLLSIPRDIWDEADMNNWTEGRIRDVIRPRDTSTIVEVSAPQPTMADMVFNKFADAMRGGLTQYVYLNKDGNGLFARGQSKMFVWWNRTFNGFEVITESDGRIQANRTWEIPPTIQQMYANQPDNSKWGIVKKADWDAMVNPPLPNTFAPQPIPSSFDAKKAMANILGGDDDVDMDDEYEDEPPTIARPFGGGVVSHQSTGEVQVDAMDAPHDYSDGVPSDPRYVGKRKLLHHFLGMGVRYLDVFGGDSSELVSFRDFNPYLLSRMKNNLTDDEIAQMMTQWQNMVMDMLGNIQNELNDALAEIWANVEKKS